MFCSIRSDKRLPLKIPKCLRIWDLSLHQNVTLNINNMKILISFLFAAGVISSASAQDVPQNQVPSVVVNAFQTNFSKAVDVEWEREGELYKCEFELGRIDHNVWLDQSGNVTKHKEEISRDDIPAAVMQKLKSDFKDYTVDDADKIETDGKVYFEVELDSDKGDREVLVASDGTIMEGLK